MAKLTRTGPKSAAASVKRSKKKKGHSDAHKKAISEGLKRYHASKKKGQHRKAADAAYARNVKAATKSEKAAKKASTSGSKLPSMKKPKGGAKAKETESDRKYRVVRDRRAHESAYRWIANR